MRKGAGGVDGVGGCVVEADEEDVRNEERARWDVGYVRASERTLCVVSQAACCGDIRKRWRYNGPMARPMPLLAPVTTATLGAVILWRESR